MTFTSGDNFTMTCTASGFPIPRINWLKDGLELPTIPGLIIGPEGQLNFINASPDVQGNYSCIVSNSAGISGMVSTVTYIGKINKRIGFTLKIKFVFCDLLLEYYIQKNHK